MKVSRASLCTSKSTTAAQALALMPQSLEYPLAKANEAYAHMMSGKAEFRVVLTM